MMLSRVAESLYWMQRYRERAENTARLIEASMHLNLDAPGDDQAQWFPVVATTGDQELFEKLYGTATEEKVLRFLTFDERNPNSIMNCILRSRENARSIRPIITSEMWNELNAAHVFVQKTTLACSEKKPGREFYDHIRKSCQLFTGIMDTTLSHNEAWHFGRLGNLVERADQTSRILDVKYFILLPSPEHVGTSYDDIQWTALLQSVGALEMYRRVQNSVQHRYVVQFLILDKEFPRSIRSCLCRAEQSLRQILGGQTTHCLAYASVANLCAKLSSITIDQIIEMGLHEFLDDIQSQIIEIHNHISNDFFATRPTLVSPQFQLLTQ